LDRTADDPQRPQLLLRVDEVELDLQAVRHDPCGEAIGIGLLRRLRERGDRVACERDARRCPGR